MPVRSFALLILLAVSAVLAEPSADACEPPYPDVQPSPGEVVPGNCPIEIVNNTTWTGVDPTALRLELIEPEMDPAPIEFTIENVDSGTMCLDQDCENPAPVEFTEHILTPVDALPNGATVRVLEGDWLLTEFTIGERDATCPDAHVGNATLGACVYQCPVACVPEDDDPAGADPDGASGCAASRGRATPAAALLLLALAALIARRRQPSLT